MTKGRVWVVAPRGNDKSDSIGTSPPIVIQRIKECTAKPEEEEGFGISRRRDTGGANTLLKELHSKTKTYILP